VKQKSVDPRSVVSGGPGGWGAKEGHSRGQCEEKTIEHFRLLKKKRDSSASPNGRERWVVLETGIRGEETEVALVSDGVRPSKREAVGESGKNG